MTAEEVIDDMLLRETQLTSLQLHENLKEDFIIRFSAPTQGGRAGN